MSARRCNMHNFHIIPIFCCFTNLFVKKQKNWKKMPPYPMFLWLKCSSVHNVSFDSQMPITKRFLNNAKEMSKHLGIVLIWRFFFLLSHLRSVIRFGLMCAVAITRSKRLNERINVENVCLLLIYIRLEMTMKKNLAAIRSLRTCVIHLNRLAQIRVFSEKNQFF